MGGNYVCLSGSTYFDFFSSYYFYLPFTRTYTHARTHKPKHLFVSNMFLNLPAMLEGNVIRLIKNGWGDIFRNGPLRPSEGKTKHFCFLFALPFHHSSSYFFFCSLCYRPLCIFFFA